MSGIVAENDTPPLGRGAALPRRPSGQARYRPDIDGLRAVAVLCVLLYHVGFDWIPGGYVGVDVFFVISGYLVSNILEREISGGRFSLARFYARRICRILPAFVAMVAASSAFAYHYLFPVDLIAYAWSAIAALLSVSNIYFWCLTGYFDASASTKLLIHTWSLAVEEQFYVLMPLYLIMAHRLFYPFRRAGIVLIAGLSLGLSAYFVFGDPSATFYLLHARAWELLLGAIVGFPGMAVPLPRPVREALALGGLGFIVVAALHYGVTTPFPGAAALLPCLGAAAIILAGHCGRTLAGSALSLGPVVFVGQISYSLYLWHWPIIVLQRQYGMLAWGAGLANQAHPFLVVNVTIVGVSLVMAALSWRLVEQPFRHLHARVPHRRVIGAGAGALAALVGVSALTLQQKGFEDRFSPEAIRLARYLEYGQAHLRPGQCFILPPGLARDYDETTCLAEHPGRKTYLVMGDSHAAHLWWGLSHTVKDGDVLQATAAGCKPLLDQVAGAYPECATIMRRVFDRLRQHPPDVVILSARWAATDVPRLARTLAFLQDRRIHVVVVGPMVEYSSALPRLLALAADRGDAGLARRQRVQQPGLEADVARAAAAAGVRYVSMHDLLCAGGNCVTLVEGGVPIEFDADHFTREGSVVAAERLAATGALE